VPALDKLTIDTPEQIALEFQLAGAGSRFVAIAIDMLIQGAIFSVLLLVALGAGWIGSLGFRSVATWIFAALVIGTFVISYGYFAAFEALWAGQTPGKRAVGIRVIALSGQPITTFDALVRNLLRIVDWLPFLYAVGLLSIFFTSRHQRLGDLVAGTVVVHEHETQRAVVPAPQTVTARLGARRLRVEEVEVIHTFLARREDLPYEMRLRAARQVAERIRTTLDLPQGSHPDDEVLIEAVAAEYRG
jgi:uncharacterized RDD family membrane protein YckC